MSSFFRHNTKNAFIKRYHCASVLQLRFTNFQIMSTGATGLSVKISSTSAEYFNDAISTVSNIKAKFSMFCKISIPSLIFHNDFWLDIFRPTYSCTIFELDDCVGFIKYIYLTLYSATNVDSILSFYFPHDLWLDILEFTGRIGIIKYIFS